MRTSLGAPLAAVFLVACAPGGVGGPDAGDRFPDGDGGGAGDGAPSGADGGSDPGVDADPTAGTLYSEAHFAATHNSYSGGERGTLIDQLDSGIRAIELDIHDNDFATFRYRVGHDAPGDAVQLGGGNPETDALVAWLGAIATWSDENPDHAPITLIIDLKDKLHDENQSFAQGNPAHLGELLKSTFGDRLLLAEDVDDAFPAVRDLRGGVLAVMSGAEETRLAYRHDPGHNVAVAVNASGHVIEVHDSGGGELWYWTGAVDGGKVRWYRHTQYDTGRDPAVALNDDGLVVEVHNAPDPEFGSDDTLFYRAGELGADFEIAWYREEGTKFPDSDNGNDPTVRFVDRGGLAVRELHVSENDSSNHFFWDGVIDTNDGSIEWTRPDGGGETDDPLHDMTRDETAGYAAEVSIGTSDPYGGGVLRYRMDGGDWRPIRYEQVLFVEVQHGGDSRLDSDDLWFYAADAESGDGRTWGEAKRDYGGVVRLWQFNKPDYATRTPINLPATDTPSASWYETHCSDLPCLE